MSGTLTPSASTVDTSNRMRTCTPSFAFVDAAIANFDDLTAPISNLTVNFSYVDPNAVVPAGETPTPVTVNGNFLTFIQSWYTQFLKVSGASNAALTEDSANALYWGKNDDLSTANIGTGDAVTTLASALQQAANSGAWNPKGAWQPLTKYAVGDYFTNAGSGYVAISEFISGTAFDTTHCVLVVSAGDKGSTGVTTVPVRIVGGSPLSPGSNEILAFFLADTNMTFGPNFEGSALKVVKPPAASFTMNVIRNESPIGTLEVNTDGSVVIQTATNSNVQINANDLITVTAPAVTDASISGIYFTLVATYAAQ